jgi:Zn-dependent protease with chaperone function
MQRFPPGETALLLADCIRSVRGIGLTPPLDDHPPNAFLDTLPMAKKTSINPYDYVEPGTGFHAFLGYILLGFATLIPLLILTISTLGIGLIFPLIGLLFYFMRVRVAQAQLNGSALRITPNQFPDIYEDVAEIAKSLDMDCPDVYLIESNQQNAFAVKIGSRKSVVLYDDIVHGAALIQKPEVLRFIIAHELAHHALGHTGLIRSQIRFLYRPLSRRDEFSCDAVATAVVGEDIARDALTMLLVGPQLMSQVNVKALQRQAYDVEDNKYTKKAERSLHHPLLMHRLARVCVEPTTKTNQYEENDS